MSFAQYRPENALRRARDYENAGEKDKALDHLYEVLTARKMGRQWQPAHETMMLKFIELCVEYREARKCKEGLHCYRYLQAGAGQPQPLIKIIVSLVMLSMKKAGEARARTETAAAALESVEDLDEEQSPESLLMGGVTSDGSRERAERETLVPWLRHMLDTYRNVLETLRNMPQLEQLYHDVAVRAMIFCQQYSRAGEFKKVVATLRSHLKTFLDQYRAQVEGTRDPAARPITAESVERQLSTRFYALEACADMNLWSEGFRIIEDIQSVMDKTALLPKSQLMATYYEKLARIFWVSENYLFHAYAVWRFYALSLAHNNKLGDEDKRKLASAVVLAALAIPVHAASATGAAAGSAAAAMDAMLESGSSASAAERERKEFLSWLLRWTSATVPSRDALIAELVAKGVVRAARPEVAALVRVLEGEFSPLTLAALAAPSLDWLAAQTGPTLPAHMSVGAASANARAHSLSQYVVNVERLLVFRLLAQLTAVYTTVTLAHFRSLIGGLRMSFHDVEKLLVRAVRARQLAVRIDHRAGVMRLGNEVVEATAVRRQLAELSARLALLVEAVYPAEDSGSSVPKERKDAVFATARRMADVTRRTLESRKVEIKRRTEESMRIARMATISVRGGRGRERGCAAPSAAPRAAPRRPPLLPRKLQLRAATPPVARFLSGLEPSVLRQHTRAAV